MRVIGRPSSPFMGENKGPDLSEPKSESDPSMRNETKVIARARALRRAQTPAERALWSQLSNRRTPGVKFRSQQPIGRSIVDFVSFEHRLIIELDGGHHDREETRATDEKRTAWLEANEFRVMRFWNNEVMRNLSGVMSRITEALDGE